MKRRTVLPILLCLVGVLALIGCIPLPATHQFMTNGNLKPSWKIGKGSSNPIQFNVTTIDQAIAFLDQHLAGRRDAQVMSGGGQLTEDAVKSTWRKIDDHTFAVGYELRSVILIWPLCALITSGSDHDYIILKTDEAGHVIDYDVLSDEDFAGKYPRSSMLFPIGTPPFSPR